MMALGWNTHFKKRIIAFKTSIFHLPYLVQSRHDLRFFLWDFQFEKLADGS